MTKKKAEDLIDQMIQDLTEIQEKFPSLNLDRALDALIDWQTRTDWEEN